MLLNALYIVPYPAAKEKSVGKQIHCFYKLMGFRIARIQPTISATNVRGEQMTMPGLYSIDILPLSDDDPCLSTS